MEDPDCRDQYSVIYDSGEKTGIFSNDVKEPIEVEERAVRKPLFIFSLICVFHLCTQGFEMIHYDSSKHFIKRVEYFLLKQNPCLYFSGGRKHMCAGLLKAHTWPRSIRGVLPCGVVRSSNRFRGSATRESS